MDIQSASAQASSQEGRKWKGAAMEIKHPSYYKKLKQQRKAENDKLNADNSERFVESAKPQATSVKLQASNGTSSNKR